MVKECKHETKCIYTTRDQCDKLAGVLDLHDYYVQKTLRHAVFGYEFDCSPLYDKKKFVHMQRYSRPMHAPTFCAIASRIMHEYTSQLVTLRPRTPLPVSDSGLLLVRIIAVVHKNEPTLSRTDKIEPVEITPALQFSNGITIPPNVHYTISPEQTILLYIHNVSDDDLLLQPDSITGTTTIEYGSLITNKDDHVVRHAVMPDSFGQLANVRQPKCQHNPDDTSVVNAHGKKNPQHLQLLPA
jgi:hypothetical protein